MTSITPSRISCLGTPHIEGAENAFEPNSNRKAFLLLSYLQATGQEITRDRANILLWPNARNNNNLNREITILRKHFGSTIFPSKQSSYLKYISQNNLEFDIDKINESLKSKDPAEWIAAARLIKGEYLENIDADETGIADWLDGERELWRLKGISLLKRLVGSRLTDQSIEDLAYKLIEMDRYDKDVYFYLLTYLGRNHRLKEAEHYFEQYKTLYKKQFSEEPAERLSNLCERIRKADIHSDSLNLKTESLGFIGRAAQLDYISARLITTDCRLITLKGIGGVGKTLLAKKVAQQLRFSFLDGIYFIGLENVQSANEIYTTVADRLSINLVANQDPVETIISHIQNHEILLIFDNFDHLVSQSRFLRRFLQRVKGLKCLVTSREILNLNDEEIIEISGLSFPNAPESIIPDSLKFAEDFPAVKLFLHRIGRFKRNVKVSANDLKLIGQICETVQGIPLGVELAAACSRHETIQQILEGIQTGLGYLENRLINQIDRHNGLRVAFNYSWELLTQAEQQILTGISIFLGGFQRDAFLNIFPDHNPSALHSLIDKSLLQFEPETGRYNLHPAILEFASERLVAPHNLQSAHSHYYLMTLIQHNALAGNQATCMRVIEQDIDNILFAWVKTISDGDLAFLKPSGFSLLAFYELREGFKTGFDTFKNGSRALENRVNVPPLHLNLFKVWLGNFSYRLGLHQKAVKLLSEAQYFFENQVDDNDQNDVHIFGNYALSITLTYMGEYHESIVCAKKSLTIFESSPALQFSPVFTQISIALPLIMLGNLDEAERYLRECLSASKRIGDVRGEASAYILAAQVKVLKGKYEDGVCFFERAESVISIFQDRFIVSFFNSCYGEYLFHLGDFKQAKEKFEAGLTGLFEARELWQMQRALQWLATCHLRLGEIELAENYLLQAHDLHQDELGRMAYLRGIYIHSEILFAKGDEQAQKLFDFALTHPSFPYDFQRVAELGPQSIRLAQLQVNGRPIQEIDKEIRYNVSQIL